MLQANGSCFSRVIIRIFNKYTDADWAKILLIKGLSKDILKGGSFV